MHSMSSNSSRPAVEGRGVSRRTLVKGAAHAAWVVPAVQVVSAVPAFAASGPCSLMVSNVQVRLAGGKFTVSLRVTNSGVGEASSVQLDLIFSDRYNQLGTGSSGVTKPSHWNYIGKSGQTFTFTRAVNLPSSPSGVEDLTFTITGAVKTQPGAAPQTLDIRITGQQKAPSTTSCVGSGARTTHTVAES